MHPLSLCSELGHAMVMGSVASMDRIKSCTRHVGTNITAIQ